LQLKQIFLVWWQDGFEQANLAKPMARVQHANIFVMVSTTISRVESLWAMKYFSQRFWN